MIVALALLAVQEADVAEWVRRLGSEDPEIRAAATSKLIEIGEPARTELERAAASPDSEMAGRAGYVLGEIDRARRAAELRPRLTAQLQERIPDLVHRLASAAEEDWVSVLDQVRGSSSESLGLSAEDKRAVMEALLRNAAGGGSASFTVSVLSATYWRKISPRSQTNEPIYRLDKSLLRPFLTHESLDVRRQAIEQIGRHYDRASIPALIDVLADPEVREMTVWALGELRAKEAIPALADLFAAEPGLRPAIVRAFGNIGSDDAVPIIMKSLDDADPAARVSGIEALGSLRLIEAADAIVDRLIAGDDRTREAAAEALSGIHTRRVRARLEALLEDPDEELQVHACQILRKIRARASIPALLRSLDDPSARVRRTAAIALGDLRARDASGAIAEAARDPDAEVRQGAIYALREMEALDRQDAILAGLADDNAEVRARAYEAVVRFDLKGPSVADALRTLLGVANDYQRDSVPRRLIAMGDAQAIEAALKWLREGDETLLPSLAAAGVAEAREHLLKMEASDDPGIRATARVHLLALEPKRAESYRSDPSSWVREAVVDAAARLDAEEAARILRPLLDDPDQFVRESAFAAMIASGPEAVAVALNAWLGSDDVDRRWSAIYALWDHGQALAAIGPALAKLLCDEDTTIRHFAAAGLGICGYREAFPEILKMYRGCEDCFGSEPELTALVALDRAAGVPLIREKIESDPGDASLALIETLVDLGEPVERDWILGSLDDEDDAREAAALLLRTQPGDSIAKIVSLVERLPTERQNAADSSGLLWWMNRMTFPDLTDRLWKTPIPAAPQRLMSVREVADWLTREKLVACSLSPYLTESDLKETVYPRETVGRVLEKICNLRGWGVLLTESGEARIVPQDVTIDHWVAWWEKQK